MEFNLEDILISYVRGHLNGQKQMNRTFHLMIFLELHPSELLWMLVQHHHQFQDQDLLELVNPLTNIFNLKVGGMYRIIV